MFTPTVFDLLNRQRVPKDQVPGMSHGGCVGGGANGVNNFSNREIVAPTAPCSAMSKVQSGVPTRIQALADRLSLLQTTATTTVPSPRREDSPLTSKPGTIEQRLQRMQQAEQARWHERAATVEVHARIEEERFAREEVLHRSTRELQHVQQAAALDLVHERAARRETETRLVRHIDDRYASVQRHIAREKREREEAEEWLMSEFGDTFASLAESIEEERYERRRRLDELATRHATEMRALHEELAREREQRERASADMVALLEQLIGKARTDALGE